METLIIAFSLTEPARKGSSKSVRSEILPEGHHLLLACWLTSSIFPCQIINSVTAASELTVRVCTVHKQ